MDKQQTLGIMAAILMANHPHQYEPSEFVKQAEALYTAAAPKDFTFKFDIAQGETASNDARSIAEHFLKKVHTRAAKITKIIEHPKERYTDLHVYAVDGQDVETSRGEKLKREPLADKYEGGFLWCKWILRADEQVRDLKHGGVCVGGIFCICQKGCGHKAKSEHTSRLGRFSTVLSGEACPLCGSPLSYSPQGCYCSKWNDKNCPFAHGTLL